MKAEEEIEMMSMAYGKVSLPFITEAKKIKKSGKIFQWILQLNLLQSLLNCSRRTALSSNLMQKASRRTLIHFFLREIVAQFPNFHIICEYHMALVNEAKKRRLNGKCDSTNCHRGLRNLPHVVVK